MNPAKPKSLKLFLLHIPKTAGTSINSIFSEKLDSCKLHIESERSTEYRYLDPQRFDYLSGHVRYFEAATLLDLREFIKMTILRDPFEQLVSHLNWVYHISHDRNHPRFQRQTEQVLNLGRQIADTDFHDPDQVSTWISSLSPEGHTLFNNNQTRYLSNRPETIKPTEIDASSAVETLRTFDIVGTRENLPLFLKLVANLTGLMIDQAPKNKNKLSNPKRIPNSKKIKTALFPLYCHDQVVYKDLLRSHIKKDDIMQRSLENGRKDQPGL